MLGKTRWYATKWLALLACGLLLAIVLVTMYLSGRGYQLLGVQSDSMYPALTEGQAVVVNTKDKQISRGDIVAYKSPKNPRVLVTHRVVSISTATRTFVAKGDNLVAVDPAVPMAAVVGTIQYAMPFVGYGLDALKHPIGLILVVYMPAVGIVISEIRRLTGHYAGYRRGYYVLLGRAY